MATAVTYCRISADRLETGAGVDRQRVDTDRICEQHGWTVVDRLIDNDRSASKYARKPRDGWRKLLELLESRAVDAVVAYDLDRLTRRPDELAPLIAAAERGVKIVTVTGSVLDLSTGDGIFTARVLLAVAEKEAANASRRQKAKLRHDATNGRPHWPRRPFGYNLDATVVPDEAEWVRRMVRWINDGDSAMKVAQKLNQAGVAQPSAKPWQSAGVKLFLASPRNIGMRTYNGETIGAGTWPALVDADEWRHAVAALNARSQGTRQGRRSMLTGLVRCGRCGERMTRTNSGPKAEWRCMKRTDVGTGCGQSINAIATERHIAEMVLVRIGDVAPVAHVDGTVDIADELERDLANLAAMFGRGEIRMQEYQAARSPLASRIDAARASSARSDAQASLDRLVGSGDTLAERWDDIDDVDLKRRIVSLVVDHVVINPGVARRLDLGRIDPQWKVSA